MPKLMRAFASWAWRLYVTRMLRRALCDTGQLIRDLYLRDIKRTVASLVPLGLALLVLFRIDQGEVAGEEVTVMGAWLLVLVALIVALFLINLVMSPSRVARSAVSSALKPSEERAKGAESESATLRDQVGTLSAQVKELEGALQRDDLIRVTPTQSSGQTPVGSGNTVSETVAYLGVATADTNRPLLNCRIKLLDLQHHMASTNLQTQEVVERWDRDYFYAGQTYFFRWSGRDEALDAVDIHSQERASIARCLGATSGDLTTTRGPAGHIYHGDQYHLVVEVTAENAQPVTKEYRLQMIQGHSPLIEEWDESRTTWL